MSADTFDRNTDVASSPTIKVEIYDQAYTVRSDGDPDYLKELAEYVDQRMREISSGTLTVDSRKVAILAALYIADELHHGYLIVFSFDLVDRLLRRLKTRSTKSHEVYRNSCSSFSLTKEGRSNSLVRWLF